MLGLKGPEPEQIAVDHLHANIPIPDKALLTFALKLNRDAQKVGPTDLDLVAAGLGAHPDFKPNTAALPRT